jgi:tetratricopeptide (TPR) repeat protein
MMRLMLAAVLAAAIVLPAHAGGLDDAKAGRLALQHGDYDEAIRLYSRAIESGDLSQDDLASAHESRGYAYDHKGQYDEAIADYDVAIRLKPDDAWAYSNRGNAYNKKGEHDRAIADFDTAIRLKPDDAGLYTNRGNAFSVKGQQDRAITDYDAAIRLKPDFASAYLGRGNAYNQKGEYDQAISDYDSAIRLEPDLVSAYTGRGSARFDKGEYDQAIADYNAAVRLAPRDPLLLFFATRKGGYANFGAGRFAAAATDLERTLSVTPKDQSAVLWLHLARMRAGQDDVQEFARNARNVALKAWPGPVIAFFLGQMNAEQMMAAATSDNEESRRMQTCDAFFFRGEDALLHRRAEEADQALRKAASESCPRFIRNQALAELNRMAKGTRTGTPTGK